MNKTEFVTAIAEKSGQTKTNTAAIVDALIAVVAETLAKGDDIRLPGFGSFEVSRRDAYKGRNPSTGAEIEVPARNVPKFSAGKGLKDAVNKK